MYSRRPQGWRLCYRAVGCPHPTPFSCSGRCCAEGVSPAGLMVPDKSVRSHVPPRRAARPDATISHLTAQQIGFALHRLANFRRLTVSACISWVRFLNKGVPQSGVMPPGLTRPGQGRDRRIWQAYFNKKGCVVGNSGELVGKVGGRTTACAAREIATWMLSVGERVYRQSSLYKD